MRSPHCRNPASLMGWSGWRVIMVAGCHDLRGASREDMPGPPSRVAYSQGIFPLGEGADSLAAGAVTSGTLADSDLTSGESAAR